MHACEQLRDYGHPGLAEAFKPVVFLAEDDQDMRTFLAAALRRDGLHVVELEDGAHAFAALDSAREHDEAPAIVIADIRMPGASGFEILQRVREWCWTIPVVLITAFGDDQTRLAAAAAGATGLLSKPFDIDDLRTVVAWHLPRRGSSPG